jgi:serine/threonine protein kinase
VRDGTAGYNRLADMWSAGVVMYAALSGDLPFSEESCLDVERIEREKPGIFSNERWAHIKDATNLLDTHLLVIKVESRTNTSVRERLFRILLIAWPIP